MFAYTLEAKHSMDYLRVVLHSFQIISNHIIINKHTLLIIHSNFVTINLHLMIHANISMFCESELWSTPYSNSPSEKLQKRSIDGILSNTQSLMFTFFFY